MRVKARQLRSGAATLPWRDGTIEGRGSQGKKADWRRNNRVRAFFVGGSQTAVSCLAGILATPRLQLLFLTSPYVEDYFVVALTTYFVAFPILNFDMCLVSDILIVLIRYYRIIATSEYAKVMG